MRKGSSPGFLLIELLIALSILGCVASTIAYYQWHMSSLQQEIKTYCKAINKAREALNKALDKTLENNEIKEDQCFFITQKKETLNIEGMHIKKPYHIITVTVSWKSNNNKKSFYELISGV